MVPALLALTLLALPCAAASPVPGPPEPSISGTVMACRVRESPPCGYITPILDLDFPSKPRCVGVPGSINASQCIPLPADGAAVTFNGTVRWSWKESEDLTYPGDPNQPIVITFGGTASNPSWLGFKVVPDSYTITAADLLDPRNSRNDTSGGSPVVYYWYERPVSVTFTRHGAPAGIELARFTDRLGVQPVYVKAKSTGSGGFYKEAFGGEEFRFNATALLTPPAAPTSHAAGAQGAVILTLALISSARVRRRGE